MVLQTVLIPLFRILLFSSSHDASCPRALSYQVSGLSLVCSSWSKASLILQRRLPITTRREIHENDRRLIASYHILVAYGALRMIRQQVRRSKSRPAPIASLTSPSFLSHLLLVHVVSMLLDEIAHLCLTSLLLASSIVSLRGRPVSQKQSSDDCCICLGAEMDADIDDANTLANFCKYENHVAHIGCMAQWYRAAWSRKKCPVCRSDLIVEVITKSTLTRGGGWDYQVYVVSQYYSRLY
ncbi:hypothetical protein SeMB42_g00449 [Synchytrium endobioticum]|uniref:RING-type domain-containing protein n=1 Tax=Synchytrium endobioticum TaxID=286115 RepID=A0A507DII0_9FUNG|nr:hypothetical protein SeLEV6574_g00313 [Synchytrium endobioticum]TPX54057.1 hypothetical protein SeMB42_g00449 [Synchytrium endobioticum]